MATPVVEVALVPKDEQATSIAQVIERMAANPAVDVAKLEKIIELQERLLAHQAKAAFDEAFVSMQQEMPVVDETAKGANDKAFYAPLEDVIKAVRPILSRHGFGLSHRTERLDNGRLRIVALLTHTQGHERQSTFDADPDVSGNKLDRGLDVPQPWPSTGAREAVAVVVDLMRTQAVDAIFAAVETAGRRAVMGEVA